MARLDSDPVDRRPADTHVVVGLSGGVDSAIAALTLVEQGYRVSALFMQNWEDDDEHCTARQDFRDAGAVATRIGIPLESVNFAEEYWDRVFAHFLAEYAAGRTPNPDVLCNREIKFRAFLDHARALGADAIATGHYARREPDGAGVALCRAADTDKDQTYFLHTLDQDQLSAALFPIGDLTKTEVRARARAEGLPVHAKRDSTGICFIGERRFRDFLAEYLPAHPGEIVDESGQVLGRHHGLMFHTLGQRQGLGIGGRQDADSAPWYVIDKRLDENRLVVGQGNAHPALLHDRLGIEQMHWVAGIAPTLDEDVGRFRATARIRHRHDDAPVSVEVRDGDRWIVQFDQPVRAATPGQSLVLYDGHRCLGGGIIADLAPATDTAVDRHPEQHAS